MIRLQAPARAKRERGLRFLLCARTIKGSHSGMDDETKSGDLEGDETNASGESTDLFELLEAVNSKDSFLRFLYALAADFEDEQKKMAEKPVPYLGLVDGPNGWYNHSVDNFLAAAATCLDAHGSDVPEQPSWKTFAYTLYGGKIYE